MPGRYGSEEDYRYAWNGAEKIDEAYGNDGTFYDLGARMYDARIGRQLSVDPWSYKYPWQSPYAYHRNSPIASVDWKGFGDDPEGGGFWSSVLDGVQTVIDVVGLIPAAGEVADGINLIIDIARGNTAEAALGLASMIPFVGWGAGGGKIGVRVKKIWDKVSSLWKKKPNTKKVESFEIGPLDDGKIITGDAEIPVTPNWKDKIDGKAQKTGTDGHQFRSYREAIDAAKDPEVEKVLLDKGYNKAADLPPKTVSPNRRPDVTVVKKDGSVNAVEVPSKTDNPQDLIKRNQNAQSQLPENQRGSVRVAPINTKK